MAKPQGITASFVSAGELQKNFGTFHDLAMREAVTVLKHRRPTVVMVPADEYERLKKLDREVLRVEDLSEQDLAEIAAAEIPAAERYNSSDL